MRKYAIKIYRRRIGASEDLLVAKYSSSNSLIETRKLLQPSKFRLSSKMALPFSNHFRHSIFESTTQGVFKIEQKSSSDKRVEGGKFAIMRFRNSPCRTLTPCSVPNIRVSFLLSEVTIMARATTK